MSSTVSRSNWLALADGSHGDATAAEWIGSFLALGSKISRYGRTLDGKQLILALSVPRRDFVGAIIGCGWTLVSRSSALTDPLSVLRSLGEEQPVRLANKREIIVDRFLHLDETTSPPRVRLSRSTWSIDAIHAVSPVAKFESAARAPKPEPRGLALMAKLDTNWESRLVKPEADLAMVGTLTWMNEDLAASIGPQDSKVATSSINSLLQPYKQGCATWFTLLYSAANLPDQLPLPEDPRGVILDGNSAIKFVSEITAPVVVCVIDRSVVDQTAADIVVQLRNTRSQPIAVRELGWTVPIGVEAMAFLVSL